MINEFSIENEVSYDEAAKELNALVETWQTSLQKGGRIEIERVGNLFYDEERNICFEQDRFANLLLESFGLGSVHFVSEEDVRIVEHTVAISESLEPVVELPVILIPEESKKEDEILDAEKATPIIPISNAESVATKDTVQTQEIAEPKRRNGAWKYIAAACILPIAFYSVWIPVKTDVMESGMLSFSDFNPFHKRAESTYKPSSYQSKETTSEAAARVSLNEEIEDLASDVNVYSYRFTDDTYIKVALPDNEVAPDSDPIDPDSNENPTFDANTMHYVVGCFSDKVNAENLVVKMRVNGLDAIIVDEKGGLHRVSAGGSISEESYQTVKLKADAMGLSGWRLR